MRHKQLEGVVATHDSTGDYLVQAGMRKISELPYVPCSGQAICVPLNNFFLHTLTHHFCVAAAGHSYKQTPCTIFLLYVAI